MLDRPIVAVSGPGASAVSNGLHLPLDLPFGGAATIPLDLAMLITSFPAVCTAAAGLLLLSAVLLEKFHSD